MSTETKQGQGNTPGAMRAAERIKHYEFNLEHAAQIIDRETNCKALAEYNRVLLEALNKMTQTSAGVLFQIESCAPTEMIGAAFDGREIILLKEAIKEAIDAIAAAKNGEKL